MIGAALRESFRTLLSRAFEDESDQRVSSPYSEKGRAWILEHKPEIKKAKAFELIDIFDDIDPLPAGAHEGLHPLTIPVDYIQWLRRTDAEGLLGSRALREWLAYNESRLEEMMAAMYAVGFQPHTISQRDLCREADYILDSDTLSPSQRDAVNGIASWFTDPEGSPFARLDGAAGYGKTYVVGAIAQVLSLEYGASVTGCALSFTAATVLHESLAPYGVPVGTNARTLSLNKVQRGEHITYEAGQRTVKTLATLLGHPSLLLVLDEFSMNSDDLWWLLITWMDMCEEQGRPHGRVLVVGDPKQLPPVGQDQPSAFCKVEPHWTLTEPHRYPEGSRFHLIEQIARTSPLILSDPRNWEEVGDISMLTLPDMAALVQCYLAEYDEAEDSRLLLPRGDRVAEVNRQVRDALCPDAPPYRIGDALICTSTVDAVWWDELGMHRSQEDKVRFYSGMRYTVTAVEWKEGNHSGLNCFRVQLEGHSPRWFTVVLAANERGLDRMDPGANNFSGLKDYKRIAVQKHIARDLGVDKREKNRLWADYHEYCDAAVPMQYPYACTIHKAQGRSIDAVYLHRPGLFTGRPLWEHFVYVAFTRARHRIRMAMV